MHNALTVSNAVFEVSCDCVRHTRNRLLLLDSGCICERPFTGFVHGCLLQASRLYAGVHYVDPGATAYDNVDGNITSRLSTFGVGAVDTTTPSDPSQPYVISYDVTDSAGNRATTRRRRVNLICPVVSTS